MRGAMLNYCNVTSLPPHPTNRELATLDIRKHNSRSRDGDVTVDEKDINVKYTFREGKAREVIKCVVKARDVRSRASTGYKGELAVLFSVS